jgi:Uma2 family endonuclease
MSLLHDAYPMTVEDFLAFTDSRPDGELWELIDGEPILSPSPSYGHQKVVINLALALRVFEDRGAGWEVLPGLGAKLSDTSMPVPDILVRPTVRISGSYCEDMLAAFEVLLPSSTKRDLVWKRQAYAGLPSLGHYVVLAQDRPDIRSYARREGWAETRVTGVQATLSLDDLGVTLSLADLYRGIGAEA